MVVGRPALNWRVINVSEMEAIEFCPECKTDQVFMYSGSGRKGNCNNCGHDLPTEQHANLKRVISYNG